MNEMARNTRQLGALIQRARKQRGWSQGQLAERAGIRQSTVSLIETDDTSARAETIFAILGALDLEMRVAPRSKGAATDLVDIF